VRRIPTTDNVSFLTVVIVEGVGTDHPTCGGIDAPLVAIRIMIRFTDRIIRDNVKDQVLLAVIGDLVRFAWFKDESVTRFDGCGPFLVPHRTFTREHVVKFPLSAV
jgi:hypothetical protein